MTPGDLKRLQHILANIDIAQANTRAPVELFEATPQLKYTTLYALQIVGEAASKLSAEAKAQMPSVPWDEIVSTRHVIVHGYDGVNPQIIYGIVEDDLPSLKQAIRRFLATQGQPL